MGSSLLLTIYFWPQQGLHMSNSGFNLVMSRLGHPIGQIKLSKMGSTLVTKNKSEITWSEIIWAEYKWASVHPCDVFSMLHLFLGLKSLVKVSRYHTDGSVFRLHYRVTVMCLLAFTFIVTTRQYIGKDKCRQFVFYIATHWDIIKIKRISNWKYFPKSWILTHVTFTIKALNWYTFEINRYRL